MGALAEFTGENFQKTDILKTALFFKYLDKPFNHAFNKNNQAIALKTTPATVEAVTQRLLSHAKRREE